MKPLDFIALLEDEEVDVTADKTCYCISPLLSFYILSYPTTVFAQCAVQGEGRVFKNMDQFN